MKTQVILFNGFLDSGKTTLLMEALREEPWCEEDPLIILCEEGEEELPHKHHTIVTIDSEDQLREGILRQIDRAYRPSLVFLEYNGMWLTNTLTTNLPESWQIQCGYMTADAATFLSYNLNMRSLTVDKLDSSQFIFFNRCPQDVDQQKLHDIVRKVNLKAQVSFEFLDGSFLLDSLPIRIPYDLNAPVVEIRDQDFALFYRDFTQNLPAYLGKALRLKGQVRDDFPDGFVFGRMVMICCEQDMTYCPLNCCWPQRPQEGQWVLVTAQVEIRHSGTYQTDFACLVAQSVSPAQPPETEVATYQ